MIRRLLRVAIGLLTSLVVLEATLQLVALGVRLGGRRPAAIAARAGNRPRVLCLGDSHTYGLMLERAQAYPAMLEAEWNADPNRAPIEVVNLGYPGTNSSAIRRQLPELLRAFAPHLVIVMVGVNDFWTVPDPIGPDTWEARLWRWSRVYRMLYMIRRTWAARAELTVETRHLSSGEQVEFHYDGQTFAFGYQTADGGVPDASALLRANLRAIVSAARDADVPLVLMTYPGTFGFLRAGSAALRDVALAAGVPLVDLERVVAGLCQNGECPYFLPDQHPNARGAALIARTLVPRLAGDRLLDGAPPAP